MKKILIILIILCVGIWFGINIARDRPLTSNPFEDSSIMEEVKGRAESVIEKGQERVDQMVPNR